MAIGDAGDFAQRLRRVLPCGWFPDVSPVLDALLTGIGNICAGTWDLLTFARLQTRVATAQGVFLDGAAADFLGVYPRLLNEQDVDYSIRLRREVMRDRVTRAAIVQTLTDLGCAVLSVFEPKRSTDTGGYRVGGVGYGVAGGYGSLLLPRQMFVTVQRPHGGGIAQIAGYGTGGVPVYGSASLVRGQVTDADIYAAVDAARAAGVTVWMRITN